MKVLHTNDWHLWHLTPSSRLDSWPDALFGKLDQIAQIAEGEHVRVIAVAGDIFNSVNTSYSIVNRLIEWAMVRRDRGMQVVAIAGNHDMRYNRLDTLSSTPLGTLFESGAIRDVAERPVMVEGVTFTGLPWPDSKHLARWVALGNSRQWVGPVVALGHAFASRLGGQFFGQPVVPYVALAGLPFDVFHFGHDHSARATERIDGKLFLNFGALGRGSLAAEELDRDIKVAITEFVGDKLVDAKFVKLNVRPSAEIFDLQRYAFEKQIAARFETGLAQEISADFLSMAEGPALSERVALLEVDEAVRARIQKYLIEAEESVA